MLKLKSDVSVTGIRPELLLGIVIAQEVYRDHMKDLVITSILDGKHSNTSLHYSGCAVDLRTTAIGLGPDIINLIASEIKQALTIDYDVVIEPDHIHLEFQPRRGNTS